MPKDIFYYDELLNQESTTFSIYSNPDPNPEGTDENKYFTRAVTNTDEKKEILRGVLDIDPSISSSVAWGAAPSNLNSMVANLSKYAVDSYRFLDNATNNLTNVGDKFKSWNQAKYFTVNEFAKLFQGYGTSTPLNFRTTLYPYMDTQGGQNKYVSVSEQLNRLLDGLYPGDNIIGASGTEITDIIDGLDDKVTAVSDLMDKAKDSSNGFVSALGSAGGALLDGGEMVVSAVQSLAGMVGIDQDMVDNALKSVQDSLKSSLFKILPPHNYTKIPNVMPNGNWFYGTLGIRLGTRWIFNLLLTSIDVAVSKEFTKYGDGDPSPMMADINISFTPAIMNTPNELKDYILSTQTQAKDPVNSLDDSLNKDQVVEKAKAIAENRSNQDTTVNNRGGSKGMVTNGFY